MTFVNHDGTVEMFSRKGNPLYGYDDILKEMSHMPNGYVYDGELISKTFKGTQKTGFAKTTGKQAEYNVFDCIPIDDFIGMTGGEKLSDRISVLKTNFQKRSGMVFKCVDIAFPLSIVVIAAMHKPPQ